MSVEPTAVTAREEFLALLDTSVVQNTLVKLLLSKYQGEEAELQRLTIRPVTVKGQACLSFVSTYKTRDITKNLPVAEALAHIASLLPAAFRNAHLLSLTEDVQLTFGKKDKARLFVGKVVEREAPVAGHDREKKRFLELSRPFLTDLGVTTARHELVPAMARCGRGAMRVRTTSPPVIPTSRSDASRRARPRAPSRAAAAPRVRTGRTSSAQAIDASTT